MTDIDGAAERLKSPTRVGGDGWHEYLAYDEEDVRALLEDRARLLSRNAELERTLEEIRRRDHRRDDRALTPEDHDNDGYDGPLGEIAARVLTKES